jgi:hypothetical protein
MAMASVKILSTVLLCQVFPVQKINNIFHLANRLEKRNSEIVCR